MTAPVKPEYGPTLPELVGPRIRAIVGRDRGRLAAAGVLALVAVVAAFALWPREPSFSHQGPVPVSFPYPAGLHRVAADPGAYVKLVEKRHGRLAESMAVLPLRLPAYRGQITGELPVFASAFITRISSSLPGFELISEGKARVNNLAGDYIVLFQYRSASGGPVFGRDDLVFPDGSSPRDGILLSMRSTPEAGVGSPSYIGDAGLLHDVMYNISVG